MPSVTYTADFKHPFIRLQWEWRKLGTSGWYPISEVEQFDGRYSDQAGNELTITDVVDSDFGHVRCTAVTQTGIKKSTAYAALGATLDVSVEPSALVVNSIDSAFPGYYFDFSKGYLDKSVFIHRRASEATVEQLDGSVQLLPTDNEGNDSGEAMIVGVGIQLETGATNLYTNSEDYSGWTQNNVNVTAEPDEISPYGTPGAVTRIESLASGANVLQAPGIVAQPTFNSAFVKTGASGQDQAMNLRTGSSTQVGPVTADDNWKRGEHAEPNPLASIAGTSYDQSGANTLQTMSQVELLRKSSYIPTSGATGTRAPAFLTGSIAAMNLGPVRNEFSYQQVSDVVFLSGGAEIIFAVQDTDAFSQGPNIFFLYRDIDGLFYMGARASSSWIVADAGPPLAAGNYELNLRGKCEVIGGDIVTTTWINDVKHIFTLPGVWNGDLTHVALHHRNRRDTIYMDGVCKKIRFLDYAEEDSVIEAWA